MQHTLEWVLSYQTSASLAGVYKSYFHSFIGRAPSCCTSECFKFVHAARSTVDIHIVSVNVRQLARGDSVVNASATYTCVLFLLLFTVHLTSNHRNLIEVFVDGDPVMVEPGTTVLQVCLLSYCTSVLVFVVGTCSKPFRPFCSFFLYEVLWV